MDVIHFPDDPRPPTWRSPVLALGNFDGLHRGHLKIIERIQRGAAERAGTSVVLTFDPHPPRVLRPDKAPQLLMTKPQKIDALQRAGVQGAAIVQFTREMSQWEPEAFVRNVLVEWLRVAEVWVGADFLFGRERSGNFAAPYVNLSALRLREGVIDASLELARQGVAVNEQSDRAWSLVGRALERAGRLDEAVEALVRAIQINPRVSSYYYVLATVYRRLAKPRESREAMEMFSKLTRETNEMEEKRREFLRQ